METLLKSNDVAKYLSISRSKAYGLMKSGELSTVKFGKSVRVRIEDLEGFIQNHRDSNKSNENE